MELVRIISASGFWYYKCRTLDSTTRYILNQHSSKLYKLLQFIIVRYLIKNDYFSGLFVCYLTQTFYFKYNQVPSKCSTSTSSASPSGFKKFTYNIPLNRLPKGKSGSLFNRHNNLWFTFRGETPRNVLVQLLLNFRLQYRFSKTSRMIIGCKHIFEIRDPQ